MALNRDGGNNKLGESSSFYPVLFVSFIVFVVAFILDVLEKCSLKNLKSKIQWNKNRGRVVTNTWPSGPELMICSCL